MILCPSLACADPLRLGEELQKLMDAGVTTVHADIMDGHYVPNLCINPDQLAAIKKAHSNLLLDVHLMVSNPFDYLDRLSEIGVDYLSFHTDSTNFPLRLADQIRERGMRPGAVLNPVQQVCEAEYLLKHVEYLQLMAVEPGFSGQSFLEHTYDKITELACLRREKQLQFDIEVDGGVNFENGVQCVALGADRIVGGVYLCFQQPMGIQASCKTFFDLTAAVMYKENSLLQLPGM